MEREEKMEMKNTILTCALLLFSSVSVQAAGGYAGVGLEVGSADHDLSSESFPILILEGRIGYTFENNWALEFEATANSESTKSGSGTCTTNLLLTVPCTREDVIGRQSVLINGLYNYNWNEKVLFAGAGVGIINSSYRSTYDSELLGPQDKFNNENTSALFSVEAGAIFNKRHRASFVWNAPYGDKKTGQFSYIGIAYNYLFDLNF